MNASIDFHGLNRKRVVKYLGIVANRYEKYHIKRLREWHIRNQLKRINKLSGSKENIREVLAAIKDVESKLRKSYQEHPIDNGLLQEVMTEIRKVSVILEGGNYPEQADTVVKNQEAEIKKPVVEKQSKKISMLEHKYDEMKSSGNIQQLEGMRKTIQRMKNQLKKKNS